MSLQNTPRANRLHIGIFGPRNSGKSSLLNALTGQSFAVVSDVAGTTTDPVYKSMELSGIGPVVWIDTAGFDDEGELGAMRVQKTQEALQRTDIALFLFSDGSVQEKNWLEQIKAKKIPVIPIINKSDIRPDCAVFSAQIEALCHEKPVLVSTTTGEGLSTLKERLLRLLPEDYQAESITAHLVHPGDAVLLVMPQDLQAPKGRLILPQVQTIRDLLDHGCIVTSCTTDTMEQALASLAAPPSLIITDSQAFAFVYAHKPAASLLTSFSVLFARYKGDIHQFVAGAAAMEHLTAASHVLIAEACTHAPLTEDIGRVKIPNLLRQRFGNSLAIDFVRGTDFPADLSSYNLIIHCGACMFNRRYVLNRLEQAAAQRVPMCNYGIAIAYLTGILDKIVY